MSDEKEEKNLNDQIKNIINDVNDSSESFDKEEIESGKGMGVLCYIIPFIPYFVEKKNKFVQYHAKQGMNLFIICVVYSIIYSILTSIIKVKRYVYYGAIEYNVTPWWVTFPLGLIGLGLTVIALMGIVYVLNGKAKELPIINKLKILK
jgi:uncharacterized membrane protein